MATGGRWSSPAGPVGVFERVMRMGGLGVIEACYIFERGRYM